MPTLNTWATAVNGITVSESATGVGLPAQIRLDF